MSENKESMNTNKGTEKEDKIKVTEMDIILIDPYHYYYGIKYKEDGKSDYNIGYGSYNIEQVIRWRDELFEIVKEQKEKEHGVTNEELLEHLKEIEIAVGGTVNSINTLFYIIDGRHKELQLDNEEKRMIASGMLALAGITKRMNKVSGLKEESEKLREQKEKLMQEILKELFE